MRANRPRILVADDQKGMRLTLSGVMEDRGYEVTEASDGYEALRAVEESHYDLIFLDAKMPGDGVETFRKIRKVSPGSTVVLMTGFAVEEQLTKALEQGVSSVIYKPFDMETVVDLVQSVRRTVDILIVDAREAGREGLRGPLEAAGYAVWEASDGEQALKLAKERRFDLLLMDIQAGREGPAAIDEIRAAAPGCRVILTTSGTEEESIGAAIELGSEAEGPVKTSEVLDLVRRTTKGADG